MESATTPPHTARSACSVPRAAPPAVGAGRTMARLRDDEEGAVMVIAVFMAAVLVGAIWYTLGLGEAMVYRQQMRAAVDAAAFDSSVVHALGMNMLSMMNIAMAAVLSILLMLMIVFVGSLVLTVLTMAALLVPYVDIVAAAILPEILDFDESMFETIEKVQPLIFKTLTVLNASEGVVAIIMPDVGLLASLMPASTYGGAVSATWSFSPSMVPMRAPYYSNALDAKLKSKLPELKVTKNHSFQTALKVPLLQRYGLPVQDDTYGMLCMHAGMELVDEGATLARLVSLGAINLPHSIVSPVGQVLGEVVGALPWLFCSGVDPLQIIHNLLGIWDGGPGTLTAGMSKSSIFARILKKGKDVTGKENPSMFPMKPFDETKNGGDFQQVWSWASGSTDASAKAINGVAIAGWTSAPGISEPGGNNRDFAEAEFYFDCGNPSNGDDTVVAGTNDTGGDWQDCKYNAMWNMRWKARLRRYHQFQWDIRKDIELSLYQGLGVDGFLKSFLPGALQEGSLTKTHVLDPLKACVTNFGSGTNGSAGDFGACPIPDGSPGLPNGGKIGLGSSTAYGYSLDLVLH